MEEKNALMWRCPGSLNVFSGAGSRRVVFLSRYDGELREPLFCPQGIPVLILVARTAKDVSLDTAGVSGFKKC